MYSTCITFSKAFVSELRGDGLSDLQIWLAGAYLDICCHPLASRQGGKLPKYCSSAHALAKVRPAKKAQKGEEKQGRRTNQTAF
jgi:hypothetical protein